MPRCQTSADLEIELIMTVEGSYEDPDQSVGETTTSYTAETVDDLRYEWWERFPVVDDNDCQIGVGKRKVRTQSLLEGVDINNPEVQKLLSNLLEIYGQEADEALREANLS
jgi:hypothetical protein